MEHKLFGFHFTKALDEAGSFEGYGSTWGNVDEQGDRVIPGAFTATIPDFLKRGWISDAHQTEEPIAMPTAAYEDARGLYVSGVFHTTPRAQLVRTFARERVQAGKQMGLSIGYRVPPGGARRAADGVRELLKLELIEVALTIMPANTEATVTGVKQAFRAMDFAALERQRATFEDWYRLRDVQANLERVREMLS